MSLGYGGGMETQTDRTAPPAPAFPADWPRLGFGCAPLGDLFRTTPEVEATETFAAAWECGVRYFDTAPWYGHGLSEHRLGGFLRTRARAEALVSTKVGRVYEPSPRQRDERIKWVGGLNFSRHFDYSAAGILESLAQSRLRLGEPAIDALVIHDLDREYHGDAFDRHLSNLTQSGLAQCHALREAGEISAVGMGINIHDDFEFFADWIDVDFFLVAMPYTLLDQSSLNGPMERCVARGIKIIVGAPFASGLLTNPSDPSLSYNYGPTPPDVRAKALAIEAHCRQHGVPLMAAALQFPLHHPSVVSVIPGAVSADQARQNAHNAGIAIPPELWADLKRDGLIADGAPVAQ